MYKSLLNYKLASTYLFKYIKPQMKWFVLAIIIALFLVVIGLLNIKVIQILIDSSINGEMSKTFYLFAVFIALIIITSVLNYISGIASSKLSANASMELKQRISKVLLYADFKEIEKLKAGDTLSTVNSDIGMVCEFLSSGMISLFSQFAMAIGSIFFLICSAPILALVTFAYTPIGLFFTMSLNNKMKSLYPQRANSKGKALSVVEQVLTQIPVIKSFIMENQIKKKIFNEYQEVYQVEMKLSTSNSLLQSACSSTSHIPRIIYLVFAGYMVMQGYYTLGAFIAVFDLLNYIIAPTVYFPFMLNGLNSTIASIHRIKKLEDIIESEKEYSIDNFSTSTPEIQIENISFGYSKDKDILKNFSFSYKGNGIIILTGQSGSGKTTLLDLISGLYSPNKGEVKVNGSVSVMTQNPYLFNDSLFENVRIARLDAKEDEIFDALKFANVSDFAESLVEGYNTILGDGNVGLSGGQRQRIALARTILEDKPIWLLDEPTSALDEKTEKIVLDVIMQMSSKKMIVISAHKKSIIDLADKIISLEQGELL